MGDLFETYCNVVRKEFEVAKPESTKGQLFTPDPTPAPAPAAPAISEIDYDALADLIIQKMGQKAATGAEEGGAGE